ncbi:MAG: DUF4234 domain-containing protein [Candidatus Woesearchaeota archaeon]
MKKRDIIVMILLTIITFGLYMIYWSASFQSELKKETGLGFNWFFHLVLLFATFGIYAIYWQYAAGKRLAKLGAEDYSILYLLLIIFAGSGAILNPFIMQYQANKL